MDNNIKNELDAIIGASGPSNASTPQPTTFHSSHTTTQRGAPKFDQGEWRDRYSMIVLKDIISAMMNDENHENMGTIMDASIGRQLTSDSYTGAYDYIQQGTDARDSHTFHQIVQEIDEKVKEDEEVSKTTGVIPDREDINIDEILKKVDNYDELREKIKKEVSEKVINDVTNVIASSNDAPVFDKLDEKLVNKKDATQESMILHMTAKIVQESDRYNPMSHEEGLLRACVEYCVNEMNILFGNYKGENIYQRYPRKKK